MKFIDTLTNFYG